MKCLLATCLLFFSFGLGAGEILKNGDFEQGTLESWYAPLRGSEGQKLQTTYKDSTSGSFCLRVTGDPAGKYNKNLWLNQPLPPLTQKREYLISFKARSNVKKTVDKYFQVSVCQMLENNQSIVYTGPKISLENHEWAEYTFSFSPHTDARKYIFFVTASNLDADDAVFVDDLSLREVPALKMPEGEFIQNGNFETGSFQGWNWPLRGSRGQELQFINRDTDYGRYCLKISGDPASKYNSNLWMNQTVPVLKQKTEYIISFRGRANVKNISSKKYVKVSICQMFPNGGSIVYTGPYVDLSRPTWTHYELCFMPDHRAGRYDAFITASNLDLEDEVFIDEVSLMEARSFSEAFDPAQKAQGDVDTINYNEYTYTLDKNTGVMTSLAIDGEVFQPLAKNSGVIYVVAERREYLLDGKGNMSKDVPFQAIANYEMVDDMLRETVVFTATEDANGPFKLGLRHGFDSSKYRRIINSLHPVRVIDAKQNTIYSYQKAPNDQNLSRLESFQYVCFPMAFLESDSSYLMAGSLLLDDSVTCSPNIPMNTFPSVQRNPLSVKKGDTFRFEINYKRFSKTENLPRDVWRFYSDHTRTNIEALKPFIPPRYTQPRAYYPGNFGTHTYFVKEREERLFPNSNIWFYSWHDLLNERYPIEGEWYCEGKAINNKPFAKVSAEEVRGHIAHLQKMGHKCALYLRSLANARLCGSKYPEEWYYKAPGVSLYGGGYELPLPEHVAKEVGYNTHKWASFDLNNEEYREFFMDEILQALEFYKPMAIGWDCMVGRLDLLLMTATVYDYIQKNKIPIKCAINEGGPLDQAYNDQVIIENGFLSGKLAMDFEMLRAYTTTISCEERFNLFHDAVANYFDNARTWLSPAGLAVNARYIDYLLSIRPELKEKTKANRAKIGQLCQLRASLYDVGHGACAGYMDEAKPVPPAMLQFCHDAAGLVLVNKSFALRLPTGADTDENHAVAAWCDAKALRLMLWNDESKPYAVNLKLDQKHFASLGWSAEDMKAGRAVQVTPEGEEKTTVTITADGNVISITGKLPPFAGLMIFAEKAS